MLIALNEHEIAGTWNVINGKVVSDAACQRILDLIRAHLVELASDDSGWNTLYKDPNDGRLWELTYPQSELAGGGPPKLECISVDQAKNRYPQSSIPEISS